MGRECDRIAEPLEETFEGRAYYGPSITECLKGVDADDAARRPDANSNSIWDIVNHLTLEWDYHRDLITGGAGEWIRGETTWSETADQSAAAWSEAVAKLKDANRQLVSAIREQDDEILSKLVPELDGWTFLRSLHGTLHHGIYHSGQILMLRRYLTDRA